MQNQLMNSTENEQTYQLAKQKAMHYCSYQERTIAAVRKKLLTWGLQDPVAADKLMQALQAENFLDEKRYIATFIQGRFAIKKWGKRKIYYALLKQGIGQVAIQEGLNAIEAHAYLHTIEQLIMQKNKSLATIEPALAQRKIIQYLVQKGYELELVQNILQTDFKTL